MQDLNDMLYFAEVVERGGFSAAARNLGLPKSRLSRRVAELEAELGVRLLQRTTRKLSLTPVGELYYRHCQTVRLEADAAAQAVAQVRSEPRGTLRVVCPLTLAHSAVAEIAAQFMTRYPEVRLEMEVDNRVVDLVAEGVDVALRVRASLDESGSLVIKRLGFARGLLVMSPQQVARQGQPKVISDLMHFDSVAMSAANGRVSVPLYNAAGDEYVWQHQPRYVADDLFTLKVAVLEGVGLCNLPDYMCQTELQSGQLIAALPAWAPKQGYVHAVYPSRRGLVPAVRAFLDYLGEGLAARPYAY